MEGSGGGKQRCPEFFSGPKNPEFTRIPNSGFRVRVRENFLAFGFGRNSGHFPESRKLNDEFTFDGLVQKMQNQNKISKGDETTATVQ